MISALTPQIGILFHSVNLSTTTSQAAGTVHCSTCIALTLPTTLVLTRTGQFAEKPTRGQTDHGLVISRTSQLAKMFDLKFGVYNSSKCYFRQIILFIRCHYSIGLELGLGLGLMYK